MRDTESDVLILHNYGVPKVADCAAGLLCRLNRPVLKGDTAYEIPRQGAPAEIVHAECIVPFAVEELSARIVEAGVE